MAILPYPEVYVFSNGYTMKREEEFNLNWVMRNEKDEVVARGAFRNDVCEHVGLSSEMNDKYLI
jgi:hypothetical protein